MLNKTKIFAQLPVLLLLVILFILGKGIYHQNIGLSGRVEDKSIPSHALLNVLDAPKQLNMQDMNKKSVYLLHFFATWCGICKDEHQDLNQIAQLNHLPIIGVLYKDIPDKGKVWVDEMGNPYQYLLADIDGTFASKLGVYGTPETFIVSSEGQIIYRYQGAMNMSVFENHILPNLPKAAES